MKPSIELISTGTELLNGRTVNRHAQTLARHIASIGFALTRDTTVPDDKPAMIDVLRGALERVDVVMLSGGLGPTSDDVTRDAVAEYLGRGLVFDPPAVENIRRMCERTGRDFTEGRKRQALIVEGAEALQNSVGAAPGMRIDLGAKTIFLLPGPPDEFLAILTEHVVPWLAAHAPDTKLPAERIFLECGMAEADLIRRFDEAMFPPPGVDTAFCAAPGRVEIRLSCKDEQILAGASETLCGILGHCLFARERVTLAEAVGKLLADRKQTLATAESCTGGLLGGQITDVSGSSAYYLGGIVSYSNDVKVRELGVAQQVLDSEGAVSAAVARQMAVGVRERLGADFGIGITGVAGSTGGTSAKPVGLVIIAVADAKGAVVREHRFGSGRERVREWSCQTALNMLRLRMMGAL